MRIVQTWDVLGQAPAGVERHCPILWHKWEYAPGQYDFAAVDAMLAKKNAPCHLQIIISMYGKTTGLLDYTPTFHKRSLKLTASNGKAGDIPDYANLTWRAAYVAAVKALAEHYRDHPQIVAYWHALGLNQETQATCRTNDGTDWNTPAAKVLDEQGYYDFLVTTTGAAQAAWGRVPVYVPGAPNPGGTWGRGRGKAAITASLLTAGARYQMCGLLADNANAFGVGARAGLGLTDIITATGCRCAFEPMNDSAADPWELYWLLCRAAHWQADFVDLPAAWLPHYPTVAPFVPRADARWLVFRDAEYPPDEWTGGDGQQYGQSGEPGCWGQGLTWGGGGKLTCDKARYDWGRWQLVATEPVLLRAAGLADGTYGVTAYRPPNDGDTLTVTVQNEQFTLPVGTYHRVDLGAAQPVPDEGDLPTVLRAAAEAHDVLAVNPAAALCKAARARDLWPTSNEFAITYGGTTYIAQRFRAPATNTVVVLYCVRGQWADIHELAYVKEA